MKNIFFNKSFLLIFIAVFLCALYTYSAFSEPPAPPKKLKVESANSGQVNLSWQREAEETNESILYKIYQKFSNLLGTPADYTLYNSYNSYSNFTQAQYSDMPSFKRDTRVNQYRKLDEIPVSGETGSGTHTGQFLNAYNTYSTFQADWSYSPEDVQYLYTGSLPEKLNRDELGRKTVEPIFKVAASRSSERSLGSAESEGKRLEGPNAKQTLPAPEDLTAGLMSDGNVRLDWSFMGPNAFGLNSVKYLIYQVASGSFGSYGTYSSYQNYNFLLLDSLESSLEGTQSYTVPASKKKPGSHEFYSGQALDNSGIYKVVAAPGSAPTPTSYTASPASPESQIRKPILIAAVSRLVHSSGGVYKNFDIPLDFNGVSSVVESRKWDTGRIFSIVLTFDQNIEHANVTPAGEKISSYSASGNTMTITLSNIVDGDCITISISGAHENNALHIVFLRGDVDGNRIVNRIDAKRVKNRIGQRTTSVNARYDISRDRYINQLDLDIVNKRLGKSASDCS
ncbi:MAG: hypothetical protein HY585_04180 [Candidatus Omnitrophica bacterium]|nr:hypothetical protein [Candidatus Omnitrophota bacterium]